VAVGGVVLNPLYPGEPASYGRAKQLVKRPVAASGIVGCRRHRHSGAPRETRRGHSQ